MALAKSCHASNMMRDYL